MRARARRLLGSACLGLALAGCPVTDDYYLLPGSGDLAGSSTGAATGSGGSGAATASQAGSNTGATGGTVAGSETGGSEAGGALEAGGETGEAGGAGAPSACEPMTERCNGHDDNCNDLTDEQACQLSCFGFVLTPGATHGYMYCTGNRKATWSNAQKACQLQNMRLAWLESSAENQGVTSKVDMLGSDAEVLFGATDQQQEDEWVWEGGAQFWDGDEQGMPVDGAFNAWVDGTPNDANNNEDCAILMPMSAEWGDRSCDAAYAFICEDLE